ncbi:reverse transcriptase domain-containing protein [Tanacetum coccineum]
MMEKTMKRYGVSHRFSTSYHPQTSGQVENTNRALKRILEKIVKDNPAIWSRKLDNALWAFRTAYKTPTGTTPYKLTYGKNYHLPFEIEHRAYWALKNCNPYLIAAGEKRMFQLHELDGSRSPKRTSTSEAPAMTQAAIKKLVANSVSTALEAQAANMANTDNTTRPREAPIARQCSYKEFMSFQPINSRIIRAVVFIR